MSKQMSKRPVENAFSRCKYGMRKDLGIFFRSAWEANYARYLDFLQKNGQIISWEYEPKTFWFEKIQRGVRSYKPDFHVQVKGGVFEWHEVKGWMYPRAKTALKRFKKYYPQETLVLIDQKRYNGIARSVRGFIKGWE